jgi:uncharacterized protein YbaP (TraB family)
MKIQTKNIQLLTLLLFGVFISGIVSAKSCLWKVTSETGSLYVQGSVHLLKASHYPLDPAIERAYAESKVLVLEVDMQEMASPETQQKILKKALLPAGQSLKELINKTTFQQLETACAQANLPFSTLAPFKPWFAAMTLTLVKTQKMGFEPQYGLDKYFYDKARAEAKNVIGLETVDFQINLFDSLSGSKPDDFIAHTLAELATLEQDLEQLDSAWISGNIQTVGTIMAKSFEDYPDLYNTFVLNRNKRWVKKLDGLLKKSSTHMVVVGAGHLPGKGGLLELLKNKGYVIEQL